MTTKNELPSIMSRQSHTKADGKNTAKSFQPLETADRLPKGWHRVKLGDACKTSSGGTPSRGNKAYYAGSIPWIKSGELKDGIIEQTEESISKLALAQSSAKLLPAGSLLVAMYGANVGKLGVTALEAATNQAVCAVIPGKDVDRDFLFWHLLSERENIIETSFGGAQPNISQAVVRSLEIPLPPLAEQKRIAGILKEQMAAVEKARAAAEAQLGAARALPAAYLREVFESDETKRWPEVQLGNIAEIQLGKMLSPKSKTGADPQPYLRNTNVQWNSFALKSVADMDFSQKERKKFELRKGDLLVCEGGDPGRAAVWDGSITPCYYQKALHRIRPNKDAALADFILYRLMYAGNKNEFIDSHAQTTIAHLPLVRLKALRVCLPPITEQKDIVAKMSKRLDAVKETIRRCEQQLNDVNALPGAILRKAFNGEF